METLNRFCVCITEVTGVSSVPSDGVTGVQVVYQVMV